MGAPKPGSTFQPTPPQGGKGGGRPMPPQGGKGAVQPQRPPNTYPGMPLTPNPSSPFYFPNGPEASAQALNQGKGQGVPMGGMLGGGGNPMQPGQPTQSLPLFNNGVNDALSGSNYGSGIPPQGGKAPITLPPGVEGRPIPQVSPPQGIRFPSDFTPPAPGQTYINPNINPAGFTGTLPPRLQQPAPVMPRPAPQVMPRPAPQVMPRGLAGLRGRR
jgi:hypothetical protein